jgi:hypothetical protein
MDPSLTQLPAFFYGATEALLVSCYCFGAWKMGWTKAPSDAPFWKAMFTSYEVVENEQKDVDVDEIEISESSDENPTVFLESTDGNILTTYFNMEAWGVAPTKKTAARTDEMHWV